MSIYAGIVIELSGVIIALLGIMYQLSRIADDLATGEEAAEQEQNKAADVAEPTDVRSETPTQRLGTPPLRNEPVAPDRAEELAREIADIIKTHETSYAQRESGLWRWACTCGKLETVNSRDACVSATQHHWGQAVASLLRPEMGRWIPVSETIPPVHVDVLIWCRTSHNEWGVRFGKRTSDGHWRPEGGNGNFDDYVTHWQPLPAPPREEG